MPMEYLRWQIARNFGWTLAEVDSLTMSDLEEFLQIEDGKIRSHGN